MTWVLFLSWVVFALAVAITTIVFIELTHFRKKEGQRRLPSLPLRSFAGGIVVVAAWRLIGTSDYLGLGVPSA
jgi:hypothetical protein